MSQVSACAQYSSRWYILYLMYVQHGMCTEGCPVIVAWLFAFQHHLMATGSTHIGGLLAEIRRGREGVRESYVSSVCKMCT